MATFDITITNGQGNASIPAGTFTATASVTGYSNATLSPTSVTIGSTPASNAFTIAATGTLTFTVNETGAAGGTPVTSGTIIMTDSTGTTQYGTAQNISVTGQCVFSNVPFGDSSTPFVLYFKQLTTDSNHLIDSSVITVNMTSSTVSQFVLNQLITVQTATLTDANYTNLPVPSGTITLSN